MRSQERMQARTQGGMGRVGTYELYLLASGVAWRRSSRNGGAGKFKLQIPNPDWAAVFFFFCGRS